MVAERVVSAAAADGGNTSGDAGEVTVATLMQMMRGQQHQLLELETGNRA